jgi:hypothetical protein
MAEPDQAHESLRHWGMVAPTWEASRERLFENLRSVSEWLVDHVRPEAGQTILELTAGPGETGFLAASRLGPDGRLISSDFAPAMVDAAKRGAAARGLDNVDCRVIDATHIDLPGRQRRRGALPLRAHAGPRPGPGDARDPSGAATRPAVRLRDLGAAGAQPVALPDDRGPAAERVDTTG